MKDSLFKINLLGFEFAGERGRLKSTCEGVFLQFNPVKQESRFTVGSSEGQVRSMASPVRKLCHIQPVRWSEVIAFTCE